MPYHLHAEAGDVAPVALLVGDPARAERIAGGLDDVRCYNRNRGLLGFTGHASGERISVQTTGMGGPSASIVVEELAQLGAATVIRLGTCGALAPQVGALDIVIATGAVPADGTTREYLGGRPFAPVADFEVVRALVESASQSSRRWHAGIILSHDAFYALGDDGARWGERGVLAVEMETSAVLTVALHRGLRAGAACLVVAASGDGQSAPDGEAIDEALAALIAIGLDAATVLSEQATTG